MFTASDRAKLADLVRRAAENPMDFRDFGNPQKAAELNRLFRSLSVRIGTLMIAVTHDRMPPHWLPYRHLSVSDHGDRPSEAVFLRIASEVGMGAPEMWDQELCKRIEQAMSHKLTARHAFRPVTS